MRKREREGGRERGASPSAVDYFSRCTDTLYHLSSKIPHDFTLHITIRSTAADFFKQQIFINVVDDRSPTRSPLTIQWRQNSAVTVSDANAAQCHAVKAELHTNTAFPKMTQKFKQKRPQGFSLSSS